MYSEDRSDFAAPIAAFLFIALVTIMSMVYKICVSSEFLEINIGSLAVIGIAGLVIAGFNLYKGYLPEGFSVALFSVYTFVLGTLSIPAAVGLGIMFAFCALVCYTTGILDLAIINGCFAIISVFTLGTLQHPAAEAIVSILMIVPALVALYVAYCDWTFAQEVLESYEDEFLDDECDCCCDDPDCDCGDDCCCQEEHPEGCTCDDCAAKEETE